MGYETDHEWNETAAMADDVEMLELTANGSGVELMAAHPMFGRLAQDATALLREAGAANYLTIEMTDKRDMIRYTVTVQREDGEHPAAKACRLQAELDQLRFALGQTQAVLAWEREQTACRLAAKDQAIVELRDELGQVDLALNLGLSGGGVARLWAIAKMQADHFSGPGKMADNNC